MLRKSLLAKVPALTPVGVAVSAFADSTIAAPS